MYRRPRRTVRLLTGVDSTRSHTTANGIASRIRGVGFGVPKEFDSFDLSDRLRCTGSSHKVTAIGLVLWRRGQRMKFATAATLVSELEAGQQQHLPRPDDRAVAGCL